MESNAAVAKAYYAAMRLKDVPAMAERLHPNIHLITPLVELTGKEAVLEAVRRPLVMIENIEVRSEFESGDQAMLAYYMQFPAPIGVCRAAALMTVKEGLIVRNELFFDARQFAKS